MLQAIPRLTFSGACNGGQSHTGRATAKWNAVAGATGYAVAATGNKSAPVITGLTATIDIPKNITVTAKVQGLPNGPFTGILSVSCAAGQAPALAKAPTPPPSTATPPPTPTNTPTPPPTPTATTPTATATATAATPTPSPTGTALMRPFCA